MIKSVIIVAGGSGQRMGAEIPKQFLELKGLPILMHTINAFYKFDNSINIILVIPEGQVKFWEELCEKFAFSINHKITFGGETRFHSVKNGLSIIDDGFVAIHDAVRPLVSVDTIKNAFATAEELGNGIPVIGISESVRFQLGNSNSVIDREKLRIVQTPQVFKTETIKNSYDQEFNPEFTDDASVNESAGERIYLSEGNRENIKITSPTDLIIAESLLKLFED